MLESKFQSSLIKEIKKHLKDCLVIKNDPNYIQGLPDLLILYKDKWAALECKAYSKANKQPNQEYYISLMNKMSFASFINPENKEDILNELYKAFKS